MDKYIERMGNKFRGLWRSRPVTEKGVTLPFEWFVTFEFRGEMQEVGAFSDPIEALRSAINTLEIE